MTRRALIAIACMVAGVVILAVALGLAFGFLAACICVGAALVLVSILIGWT